jgi:metallophosphoesterase (TIGR00282 family)
MRILFLGDIFSNAGRKTVRDYLPEIVRTEKIDLALANGENASGGRGLAPPAADELLSFGLKALTGGNHSFQFKEIESYMGGERPVVRPYNYPEPCPGKGWVMISGPGGIKVALGNLMGRVFIAFSLDCPFRAADKMLAEMKEAGAQITILDFHAEATAEKKALAYYLDGRVGAVLGTHTHIQTSDHQILPKGTAYMTDVGMSGPHDSIIGMESENVIKSFLYGRRFAFSASSKLPSLQGVVMDFDDEDFRAKSIKPLNYPEVFQRGEPPGSQGGDTPVGEAQGGQSPVGETQGGQSPVGVAQGEGENHY